MFLGLLLQVIFFNIFYDIHTNSLLGGRKKQTFIHFLPEFENSDRF